MATPLSAAKLVSALKAEGVKVREYRSWRTHNRNHVGSWGPVHGVMIHHTVTSGTESSVDLCYDGHSTLPGPLCHGVIADGTVHLVGHGRANHAGSGDRDVLDAVIAERALPSDNQANTDGNRHFYGFEAINLGDNKDPWPPAQVEAIVRASAAICRAHGWGKQGTTSVIGHSEWQPGKVDPRGPGITMNAVRKRVAERLRHPADWSPGDTPEHPEEDDDMGRLIDAAMTRPLTIRDEGVWVSIPGDTIYGETAIAKGTYSFAGARERYRVEVDLHAIGLTPTGAIQLRVVEEDGRKLPIREIPGTAKGTYGGAGREGTAQSRPKLLLAWHDENAEQVVIERVEMHGQAWPT
ncbi:N-acetylmuramoyl-L-alanine amidase [Streptomyces sp. MP131-18]|uniref:N-acetylmuramoyl-L-alanine amidase n=1 Tax=Streptomyces sp. MP131-18 TaxID=1857892 RepID=UPI0009A1DC54|nr:N-acetylmuramoyl-L-alanine amidase [Streptomyces sp. MP131-18]ONK09563.1 N-acetylmuramoyl-L-alanine amidase [Streptomyces sp. MP131-18]